LLAFHVAQGDGKVSAQVALLAAHSAITARMPSRGSTNILSFVEGMAQPFALLTSNEVA
jgi:hypothetical protein